jgi:hypothetical protein
MWSYETSTSAAAAKLFKTQVGGHEQGWLAQLVFNGFDEL